MTKKVPYQKWTAKELIEDALWAKQSSQYLKENPEVLKKIEEQVSNWLRINKESK